MVAGLSIPALLDEDADVPETPDRFSHGSPAIGGVADVTQHRDAAAATGGDIQCNHKRDRIRKHVGIELSRHVQHGQADGSGVALHDGCRCIVPAGIDGRPRQTKPFQEPHSHLPEAAE